MVDQAKVFEVLAAERAYQDRRWKAARHSVTEFLVYMQDYVAEALHHVSRNGDPEASEHALHNVRKVAALGIACMEQHGAPSRNAADGHPVPPDPAPPLTPAPSDVDAYLTRTRPAEVERDQMLRLLDANEWNIARVARLMDCTRRTVYMRLAKHGIDRRHVPKVRPSRRSEPRPVA